MGGVPLPPPGGGPALENPLEWRILRSQKTPKKGSKLTPQTMVHSYIIETRVWTRDRRGGTHLYGERRAQCQLNRMEAVGMACLLEWLRVRTVKRLAGCGHNRESNVHGVAVANQCGIP